MFIRSTYFSSLILFNNELTITDFPVPDGPVKYKCFLLSINTVIIYYNFTTSFVGTIMLKKAVSLSYINSGVISFQLLNIISYGSK